MSGVFPRFVWQLIQFACRNFQRMMIQFVTGAESFDNWDAYLQKLNQLKMDEYMEIESAAYSRYVNAL